MWFVEDPGTSPGREGEAVQPYSRIAASPKPRGSSPGEKLSLVVVGAEEAVGRWWEVGRGPAFHNSAVGRVGRAIADQAVGNRLGCAEGSVFSGCHGMDLSRVLVIESHVWAPVVVEPYGFIDSASGLLPAEEGPAEAVLLFEDAIESFCS